jgi:opacity protein-like surface antigen
VKIRGVCVIISSILAFLPWRVVASAADLNQEVAVSAAANEDADQFDDNADNKKDRKIDQKVEKEVQYVSEGCHSAAGFYGGAGLGFESVKNQFKRVSSTNGTAATNSTDKVKKSNSSLTADVFGGYNFQIDKVLFGLECSVNFKPSKTETEVEFDSVKRDVSARRRYSFGICPRIGYNIFGGLIGYVKLGTDITKYNVRSKNKVDTTKETKKNSHKTVIQTAIGLEQHFGQWFVRGECSKFFGKHVGTLDGAKVTSGSWGGVIGAGYRF